MRILIADASPDFANAARHALRSESLVVEVADTAADAFDRAAATPYAVVVIDLALPDARGMEVLKRLRRQRIAAPILALTSDPTPEARIEALRLGADDCLVKPVLMAEFAARIHALTRRAGRRAGTCIEVEDLVLHCDSRRAFRAGSALPLTHREFRALEHLVRAHGQPVPATELRVLLWHEETSPKDNFVAVLMMRLRKKVDTGHPVKLLHTIRGIGYAAGARP